MTKIMANRAYAHKSNKLEKCISFLKATTNTTLVTDVNEYSYITEIKIFTKNLNNKRTVTKLIPRTTY